MRKFILVSIFIFTSSLFTFCEAQYNVLYNFNSNNSDTTGGYPYGSLTVLGNKMYGMVLEGGVHGTGCIFSINKDGSGYTDIFDFGGGFGGGRGSLTYVSGKFYGMAYNIFSIDTNGSNYKELINFNDTDGKWPYGSLTYNAGMLYGMTYTGGTRGYGVVFSLDTSGARYKDLLDFNDTNGGYPYGDVTYLSGKLYGMTYNGGKYDDGLIFSIDTDGSSYKKILDFNSTNGEYPKGSLTLYGNKFYGMVLGGGANGFGSIFSIDTDGSGYKDVFDFNYVDGANPTGSLIISGYVMYGLTSWAGKYLYYGNLFSIDTDGTRYRNLFNFNGADGSKPYGSLSLSSGILYGVTSEGGSSNEGVIFSFDTIGDVGVNNEPPTTASINVYPNPSSGAFTLRVENEKLKGESGTIELYNVLGEKVYSQLSTLNSQLSIDLSNQPNGIYLYRIMGDNGGLDGEGKLIIQK